MKYLVYILIRVKQFLFVGPFPATLLLICSVYQTNAQEKEYELNFRYFNETYRPVSADSSFNLIEPNEPWDSFTNLNGNFIDFEFILGSDTLTYFNLDHLPGGMSFYPAACGGNVNLGMVFEWELQDRGLPQDTSLSPVYRIIETDSNGYKRLILEWRNATSTQSTEDSINFQIVLYEEGNKFEYRFGQINISGDWLDLKSWNDDPGPFFVTTPTVDCENPQNTLAYFLRNESNDSEPVLTSLNIDGDIDSFIESNYLKSPPKPGDVWQFTLEEKVENHTPETTENSNIKIYPNPTNTGVFHVNIDTDIMNINIIHLQTGYEIPHQKTGKRQFSITSAKPGIYLIQVETTNRVYREKLIISH